MFKLYGFPVSNYVCMVEFALMEKRIPYEYVLTFPDQSEELLAKSPRGKVPVLETPDGFISETNVIIEYLDDLGQGKPLLPSQPYERARVRALLKEMELYLELPARSCFAEALFGTTVPDAIKEKARNELLAGFAAIKRHASFTPYVAGGEFTVADIMFFFGAGVASSIAQSLFNFPSLDEIPGAKRLIDKLSENSNLREIVTKRDAATPAFIAHMKATMAVAA